MSRARTLLTDFRAFVNRGNVVDLAVAVVIGGDCGKLVNAVVTLVMESLLQPIHKAANIEAIANWNAGAVLVAAINFLVIAFVVFIIVCSIEVLGRKEEAVAPPDTQVQLAAAVTRLADAWTAANSEASSAQFFFARRMVALAAFAAMLWRHSNDAIEKSGNNCPSGWFSLGDYCVKSR